MHRFVLLYHEWPTGPRGSHCDLMLEAAERLRTWSLVELPRNWAPVVSDGLPIEITDGNSVAAEHLADHRLAYLNLEGPVSGDRGAVRRLDGGHFETLQSDADVCEVVLAGEVLKGAVVLRRVGETWHLTAL